MLFLFYSHRLDRISLNQIPKLNMMNQYQFNTCIKSLNTTFQKLMDSLSTDLR